MNDFWFGLTVGCLMTIVAIVTLVCLYAVKRGGKK